MKRNPLFQGPTRPSRNLVSGGFVAFALYLAFLAWWVYAICCIMNHFDVWPFSLIGG